MKRTRRPSPRRSLILSILCAVACSLVFAWGLYTGKAMVPARYISLDVAQRSHQMLFWLTEAFWLFFAISAAFVAFEEARQLEHPTPAPAKPAPLPNPVPAKPKPSNHFGPELRSTSPTGRYVVNIYPQEMRMSHSIECPALLDTATGQILFSPKDSIWSLESAAWASDTVVTMQLLKYPDGGAKVEATFDCANFTASVDGAAVEDFRNSAAINRALNIAQEIARRKRDA